MVYFMPLAAGHYISHQWARELKNWQQQPTLAAIHFKLPSSVVVWHGYYYSPHQQDELGQAIRQLLALENPLGYEFFLEQAIDSSTISKIVPIHKPLGWRYFPSAHGRKPCYCPACARRGEYGQSAARQRWLAERGDLPLPVSKAREMIANSTDAIQLIWALEAFMGKTHRDDPSFLFSLLETDDELLRYQTLAAIGNFAHPKAKHLFASYSSDDPEVKELIAAIARKRNWNFAAESDQ
ncbi:MAG: hypothetical protein HC838_00805 [Spirulinaceae cyanobacterium RM2_2_10]|nr:hypothetical protein [Spirulinaceae cyanobacterium RM2_2_10]